MKTYKILKPIKFLNQEFMGTINEQALDTYFSDNTKEVLILDKWIELIPESKMEVVTVKDECVYYETDDILIKHPTPLMKQVVKQIEKGKCYESKLTSSTLKDYIDFNNGFAISIHTSFTSVNRRNCKLLIIPMEDER